MINGMARVLVRVLDLIEEDQELREGVVALLASIADNQAAQAEYRRSLALKHEEARAEFRRESAARHKKG